MGCGCCGQRYTPVGPRPYQNNTAVGGRYRLRPPIAPIVPAVVRKVSTPETTQQVYTVPQEQKKG